MGKMHEFEDFKKLWEAEIAKIENRALNTRDAHLIHLHFRDQRVMLEMDMDEEKYTKTRLELAGLESKLIVALGTAHSRYELRNRSVLARIIEGISGVIYAVLEIIAELKRTR